MLMQQSMMHGTYHGKPATYSVMLMWGFGNLWEWDTVWMMFRQCTHQVAVDDAMWK